MAKKTKKKAAPSTGGQYRGGRAKGSKNLVKTPGGVVNQYGVTFTEAEQKALKREVDKANRHRRKMLEQEAKLPRVVRGRDTGDTVGTLHLMGKESDFILAKKSKSLQRFRSKEDYNRYLANLQRVNSPTYLEDRVRQYKRNHMKAISDAYGDEARDIVMKIRMMKPADYMRLVQSDDSLEIGFIYDPSAMGGKLNQIRASLGMKLKEDDIEEE